MLNLVNSLFMNAVHLNDNFHTVCFHRCQKTANLNEINKKQCETNFLVKLILPMYKIYFKIGNMTFRYEPWRPSEYKSSVRVILYSGFAAAYKGKNKLSFTNGRPGESSLQLMLVGKSSQGAFS